MAERTLMDALRELYLTGLTAEQQALTAELVHLATLEGMPLTPRQYETERKREYRARTKMSRTVPDNCPGHAANETKGLVENVPDCPGQKESPPYPQKKNNIYPLLEAKASNSPTPKRGCRLPENWHPSEALWQKTKNKFGITDDVQRFEAGAFRDHWHASAGRNATKVDWDCAYQNWMREAVRRRPATRKNGTGCYVKIGSFQADAWQRYANKHNDGNLIYKFKGKAEGDEVHVPSEWPPR